MRSHHSHPHPRISAALAAALILAFASTSGPQTASAAGSNRIAEALRLRGELGLRTDLAYVNGLEADASLSDVEWGIRMTDAELAEMQRRLKAQEQLSGLEGWARLNPDHFGGMYIDQKAGFVIDVAFTPGLTPPLSDLQSLVPSGVPVRVRTVSHTRAELDALVDAIGNDREYHAKLGIEVVFIATDVRNNVVEVGVRALSANTARLLNDRYGDAIQVSETERAETSACTGRYTCTPPPMRAGTALKKNNANYTCTAGFAAYKVIPGPDIDYIQMTAGHCGAIGQTFVHNGVTVGNMGSEAYGQNSPADGGWVSLNDSWRWPNVYYTAGSQYPVFSVQGQNGDFIGQTVCVSGITIGNSCGTILNDNATVTLSGTVLIRQRTASYPVDTVAKGDSGGPVRAGNTAVGIQSGFITGPTRSVFSHIWEVEHSLGITVLEQ
jgi:hypothetical protein